MLTDTRRPEPSMAPRLPAATVLVVDDEPAALRLTARMLRSMGYGVLEASSSPTALERITGGEAIDCVLTDLTMPGMSGLELAGRVAELRPGTSVVIMSGYPFDLVDPEGCCPARVLHLDKPFTMDALRSAVAAAVDRGRISAAK